MTMSRGIDLLMAKQSTRNQIDIVALSSCLRRDFLHYDAAVEG